MTVSKWINSGKKLSALIKSPEEKALETLTANGKKLTDNEAVANKLKAEAQPHLIKETVAELEQKIKAIDDQLAVTDPNKVIHSEYEKTFETKLKLEKEKAELEEKLEQRKKQDALFGTDKPAEKFDNCTMFSTADFENDYNKHIFSMSSDRINIPYITNQEDIDDRRGTISSLEDTQSNYNKYKDEENNCDIGNIEINKDDVIHTDKEQPPEPPVYKPQPLPPIEPPQEDGEQRPVIPEYEVDYSDSSFPEIGYGMDYRKDTQYKLAQYKAAAAQYPQYQSWLDQKHINYALQDEIENNLNNN